MALHLPSWWRHTHTPHTCKVACMSKTQFWAIFIDFIELNMLYVSNSEGQYLSSGLENLWWILFELWVCPITCIWLCSCIYYYSPFTGTTTGPIGCTPGVIAGVAAGCLSLSLLLTAASVVITFLCTRRCYNKKSSPASPDEKSVCYATVQSDSVQMQPSPAYQSVEEMKWTCCMYTCN